MFPSIVLVGVLLLVSLMSSGAARADAVEDFYRGKNLRLLIGAGVGGGNDTYARFLARHMARYIPGNPTFVPQNMPAGAGSQVAANLANVAPRDGSVIAAVNRATAFDPLFTGRDYKFDPRELIWLGSLNKETNLIVAWHTAPVKTAADMFTTEMVLGAQSARASMPWTTLKTLHPDWVRDKKVNILVQMALERDPELPDVPNILDFVKDPDDRALFEALFARQQMGRPFVAPPQVPADRVKALRAAIPATLADAAFQADAKKTGIDIQYVGGEEIERLIRRAYALPPTVLQSIREALNPS